MLESAATLVCRGTIRVLLPSHSYPPPEERDRPITWFEWFHGDRESSQNGHNPFRMSVALRASRCLSKHQVLRFNAPGRRVFYPTSLFSVFPRLAIQSHITYNTKSVIMMPFLCSFSSRTGAGIALFGKVHA